MSIFITSLFVKDIAIIGDILFVENAIASANISPLSNILTMFFLVSSYSFDISIFPFNII